MTVPVAIDVIGVAVAAILCAVAAIFMPLNPGRPAAVGTIVAVTDAVADQSAGHASNRGTDDTVRGKPTDHRAGACTENGFGRGIAITGGGRTDGAGAQRD